MVFVGLGKLPILLQGREDVLNRLVQLAAILRSGKNNLSTDEDEQDDFGIEHAVDQAREQLGFVRAELLMVLVEALEHQWEANVARRDYVLNREAQELHGEPNLENDLRKFASRFFGEIF